MPNIIILHTFDSKENHVSEYKYKSYEKETNIIIRDDLLLGF